MAYKDIKGQKFGKLTAIRFSGVDNGGRALWLFKCECGKEKVISGYNVSSGKTISCGCVRIEQVVKKCAKDHSGERFGKLLIIKKLPHYKDNKTYYLCKCDCGKDKITLYGDMVNGSVRSCGCLLKKYSDIDFVGQKFGRLTVLSEGRDGKNEQIFNCICDCGNYISSIKHNVIKGNTLSCGCLHKDKCRELLTTHNKSNTNLYRRYLKIKDRCYNNKCKAYKNYGGRGIKMCEEWSNNFLSFYDWAINNGYEQNLTIERIDVNGDYCPENCKWITLAEQCKNKRSNIVITFNNKTQILADWARELNLNPETIRNRMKKYGNDNLELILKPKGV